MATLRERGDGAFYMGFRPNGRRYRRSLRTRNPSIAQRRLREIQAQLELGLLREPSKTTIREFVSTFLDHQEGRRRPRTVTTQRKKLALFLEHVGTDGGISQIRPLHVSTFLDSLEVGPPTCSRYRSALHRLFEHAITRGELEMNPVRRVPAQKEEKKPPRFLAGEDRDRLLAEISRMTWEDVDFKGRKVTVPVAKSKKFRVVPLHRRLERGSPGRPRRARVLARRRPMGPGHPDDVHPAGGEEARSPGEAPGTAHAPRDVRLACRSGWRGCLPSQRVARAFLRGRHGAHAHLAPGRRGKIDEI